MSSSGVSLFQIPEIPMKHILEYLEFPAILILRKVCHDMRNFIDDSKPSSRLAGIDVKVKPESIFLVLELKTFYQNKNKIYIEYVKNGEGCLVRKCNVFEESIKETLLENEDFVTVFCKDFDIVMRHRKTVLEEFRISIILPDSTVKEGVLGSVNKFLKSMTHPLRVKSLFMEADSHNEILPVLPYMDPKSLKEIHIYEFPSRRGNILNLDEIGQLEQWKQAEELTTSGFRLPDLSQNVKHFSKISFLFRPFQTEELILLKEIFLCSSTLHSMEVKLNRANTATIGPKLIEAFGQPFLDTNQDRNWFFRVPDTNQFLRIKIRINWITFNTMKQSDVPQNAIIQN